MMIIDKITNESFERVESAINEIKACCDVESDYSEWYDIAQECIVQSFEDLNDRQIHMTYAAWERYINDDENRNFVCGIAKAMIAAVEELLRFKQEFIDECWEKYEDLYDASYALAEINILEKCLKAANKFYEECSGEGEN
jgi:hypothetical protein